MIEKFEEGTITIIINSHKVPISVKELSAGGELTYNQVVEAMSGKPVSGTDIRYTIVYTNSAERPPDGQLNPGGKVKIQEGTEFIVTATGRA